MLTTKGEGSALVQGGEGSTMAVQKSNYVALRGFRANVYDSVEETDQRHQFRAVAAGETVVMTKFEAMQLIASNKAAAEPEQTEEAAVETPETPVETPPAPVETPPPAEPVPVEEPPAETEAKASRRGKQ